MSENRKAAITGATGYTGSYVARLLLDQGWNIVNLTGHPQRPAANPGMQNAYLFEEDPEVLAEALRGCDVLVNTYWIRFEQGNKTFAGSIERTRRLIEAAKSAGVGRIVHISISNPEQGKGLPYFDGKLVVEDMIVKSGLSHCILRPTVIFGKEGILINNMAWFMRYSPVFGIPGSSNQLMQPVFVEDLARLIVSQISSEQNITMDAVGPETYKMSEFMYLIKHSIKSRTVILRLPSWMSMLAVKAIGLILRDVVMTDDEYEGLSRNLLASSGPPTCPTSLSKWITENADWLGRRYYSEIKRHYQDRG